jgi:SSS family solute:Na+ symporter
VNGLHPLDLVVIGTYLVVVFAVGWRSQRRNTQDQEGFFLAGRKLGKVTQFFLNFGNSTDANGAVSTASLVYQQGVAGVWLGFQMIFLNPYYWFMNLWFRRARLVTTADLFVDRLGSPGLARFYALFQALSTVVITIGFGNLVTYKISSALLEKPEVAWSASERSAVEGHREWTRLEALARTSSVPLTAEQRDCLADLRERQSLGELRSSIPPFAPVTFYAVYTLVVGAYIVLGGMAATALNEVVQSCLIVVFSVMLIPLGLAAAGGAGALAAKVPAARFELLHDGAGAHQITGWVLLAILANSLVQINGVPGNMPISGSARDEYAARFGAVSGTYAKRLMIILWAFCGLIALALFQGDAVLADPDAAWGTLSRQLLGPGLLGLMVTGVLAANMSTVAAQSMAVSGLVVRNVYLPLRPDAGERRCVAVGRWIIAGALILGVVAAASMSDVFSMLTFMLTVNVPFGAAIMLIFFWRRLTAPAVWIGVVVSFGFNTLAPVVLPQISGVREHPLLVERQVEASGRLAPVYFESVARSRGDDPGSPLEGRGRLHTELLLLRALGADVAAWSPSTRLAARLFLAVLTPFLLLFALSYVTRGADPVRIVRFYGKLKTPAGPDPVVDRDEMETTRANPDRFDHLKLFPRSSWEFTRWNRTDTVGFITCCGVSGGIIALFWTLLRWAAP